MPPNFPTMLGSAVPTMVVSRAASDMPSMRAIVTIILAFFVIDVCAYLKLDVWIHNRIINRTPHEEYIIPIECVPRSTKQGGSNTSLFFSFLSCVE